MTRVRLGTIAAGALLALAVLAVLAFAGAGADRPRSRGQAVPVRQTDGGPRTAMQPELESALLASADLPPGYLPSPASRVTPSGQPGRWPRGVRVISECVDLFEQVGDGATAGVTRESQGPRGSVLRQALAVLPTSTAAGAVRDARRLAARCGQFTAALDDGTVVTVEMAPAFGVGRAAPAAEADTETVAIRLRVIARGRTLEGYLTLGRVGGAISALRQLGPPGTVTPAGVGLTLRRALDKLTELGALTALVEPGS